MAKKTTAKKPAPKRSAAKDATVIYRRVSIDDVIEDPVNARKHGDVNLKSIETSLRLYGQVEPLVVQRSTMKVIGGNGRLKVMRKLGWTEVDIADTEIDNASAAALGIVLNRTAELAEWNNDILDSVLREIETGDEDLQAMLSQLAEDEKLPYFEEQHEIVEDEVPEPPAVPITKPGDLWLLGAYYECEACGKKYEYEEGRKMKEVCPCG